MLILREMMETTTLRIIRPMTTTMESFIAPVLVDMLLVRLLIKYIRLGYYMFQMLWNLNLSFAALLKSKIALRITFGQCHSSF